MAMSTTSRPPPHTLGPPWNSVVAPLVLKDCGEPCSLYWPFPTSQSPVHLVFIQCLLCSRPQARPQGCLVNQLRLQPSEAPDLQSQTSGLGTPCGVVSALLRVCSRRHPYPGWENQEGFLEEVSFKRGWSEPREV